jgi:hypothetical protein
VSTVDLILKDIKDPHIRENFARLARFLNGQVLFDGDFQLFDITVPTANINYEIPHGLTFIPEDIVMLAVEGDQNFYFKYQNFTRKSMFAFIAGPARIRFLAGRLKDKVKHTPNNFPLVPPLGVVPPPVAAATPRLVQRFTTDAGTAVGDLVRVSGANTVTKITSNSAAQIPNGVFGVGYYKPNPLEIDVLFSGIMSGYSGFTAGSPLFVSTSGAPTHTIVTTGMVQQIGFATSATEFFVHLLQPMRRS